MEENGGGDFPASQPARNLRSSVSRENFSPESFVAARREAFSRRYGESFVEQALADESSPPSRDRGFEEEFRRLMRLHIGTRSDEENGSETFPINHGRSTNNGSDEQWSLDQRRWPINYGPLALPRLNVRNAYPYSDRPALDFLTEYLVTLGFGHLLCDVTHRNNGRELHELASLAPNFVSLAIDQRGARYLQNALERCDVDADIDIVLSNVVAHISTLMVDPFGNYVVQKLIERSNEQQRTKIALALAYNPYQLFSVCLDMHGTRVVQRLLELINPRNRLQAGTIAEALRTFTVALTKSPNGHHVIQHCLRHFHARESTKLINEVAQHCVEVGTDKSGCCVLQQCVEHAQGPIREILMREIITNAVHLSQDRYGNYVVQHMLLMRMPEVTNRLIRAIEGSYTTLSFGKYGSNVVEKCLKECHEDQVGTIVSEMLAYPEVRMLFVDPFGNYVIQSALEFSKGNVRKALVDTILCNESMMKSNLYGKKILDWLEKKRLYRP